MKFCISFYKYLRQEYKYTRIYLYIYIYIIM